MRHLHNSVELLDLVKGIDARREATVEAEDVALDDGGEREVVEKRGEVLPHVGVAVLSEALVIEAVNLSDLFALVIASEDGDSVGVPHLHGHEERHGLD
eukprot:CAMPEP_0170489884 /NCGR_PEP_ID=MMETSP0208-20121228/8181_1 /TAXON_ID=197538 /ORGANISM="Strombidium inclinatum, Strain S3" /LENGTH=98 /DNA_ID=CAMNT_0010765027 /DNA_START=455 /DNA_END=751 /DNA_ORIENTATION=-